MSLYIHLNDWNENKKIMDKVVSLVEDLDPDLLSFYKKWIKPSARLNDPARLKLLDSYGIDQITVNPGNYIDKINSVEKEYSTIYTNSYNSNLIRAIYDKFSNLNVKIRNFDVFTPAYYNEDNEPVYFNKKDGDIIDDKTFDKVIQKFDIDKLIKDEVEVLKIFEESKCERIMKLIKDYDEKTVIQKISDLLFENHNAGTIMFCINREHDFLLSRHLQTNNDDGVNNINRVYSIIKRIGAESAYGDVFQLEDDQIVKIPKKKKNSKELFHEFFVGSSSINKLREKIPNFAQVIGLLSCASNEEGKICSLGKEKLNKVIYEEIDKSSPLQAYWNWVESDKEIYKMILQVMLALHYAYETCGFVHNDLHSNNILVKVLDKEITIAYPYSKFDNFDKTVYITTNRVPVVIDYGMSSVVVNNKRFTCGNINEIVVPGTFCPLRDIIRVIEGVESSRIREELLGAIFPNMNLKDYPLDYGITPLYEKFYHLDHSILIDPLLNIEMDGVSVTRPKGKVNFFDCDRKRCMSVEEIIEKRIISKED